MRTIWKYPLPHAIGQQIDIELPEGWEIVHFAYQDGTPTMWADVNTEREVTTGHFIIVGTGWEIPIHAWHIGTALSGAFVWHLFGLAP